MRKSKEGPGRKLQSQRILRQQRQRQKQPSRGRGLCWDPCHLPRGPELGNGVRRAKEGHRADSQSTPTAQLLHP